MAPHPQAPQPTFLMRLRSATVCSLFLASFVATLLTLPAADAAPSPSAADLSPIASRFTCSGIPTAGDTSLLDRIQTAYAKVTTLHASFGQVAYLSALDVQEVSTGRVWYQKPGKMRWRYESPEVQEFGIAGSEVVLYQEADHQVIVDAASSVLLSDLPVSFLLGLGNLKRDFTLLESCAGEGGTMITVIPRDAKSQEGVRLLKLAIATDTLRPLGAEVTDEAGNVTTIRLVAPIWNGAVTEKDLDVVYPKGIDVVDRRKGEQGR
jgi:outer membrane lipoprotein carrier protein